MKITLITIGKNTDASLQPLIERYMKRLAHYVKFELRCLPDIKISQKESTERQKALEGTAILGALKPSDHVILLDEKGKEPTSRQLAEIFQGHLNQGTRDLVFVIGGPFGFSPRVYERSNSLLALSRLTLTHEMVRLFFVEQVYRAFTIIRGESYHHD